VHSVLDRRAAADLDLEGQEVEQPREIVGDELGARGEPDWSRCASLRVHRYRQRAMTLVSAAHSSAVDSIRGVPLGKDQLVGTAIPEGQGIVGWVAGTGGDRTS